MRTGARNAAGGTGSRITGFPRGCLGNGRRFCAAERRIPDVSGCPAGDSERTGDGAVPHHCGGARHGGRVPGGRDCCIKRCGAAAVPSRGGILLGIDRGRGAVHRSAHGYCALYQDGAHLCSGAVFCRSARLAGRVVRKYRGNFGQGAASLRATCPDGWKLS